MPIFDQGYQHWRGPLSGHAWRWLAITEQGLRVQWKGRILRLLVLASWAPALALVGVVALWGLVEQNSQGVLAMAQRLLPAGIVQQPQEYRLAVWTVAYAFFFKIELFCILLLAVIAGPGLISRDLRFNALPLYFSRPLTRLDYFLGKLGIIAALVAAVAIGPAVFAYVIGICFSGSFRVVGDTYRLLLGSVAYGAILALSVGTMMLALSSLSRRSLYVGIAWAGLWIVSVAVAGILTDIHREGIAQSAVDAEMARWFAKHPPPSDIRMQGVWPEPPHDAIRSKVRGPVENAPQSAGFRWYTAWGRARREAWRKAREDRGQVLRSDWRPVCSYSNNLDRMADLLLDTDRAWVTIGTAAEQPRRALGGPFGPFGPMGLSAEPINKRRLADQFVWQYPWQWSAAVLAVLLGLSVWTLTHRIKSLDRLK